MFGFHVKVRIDKALYDRLAAIARAGGYSSANELIVHILQREADKFDEHDDKEVEKQLRGLGYIE